MFSARAPRLRVRLELRTTPRKFAIFRNLASMFLKTDYLRVNPVSNVMKTNYLPKTN